MIDKFFTNHHSSSVICKSCERFFSEDLNGNVFLLLPHLQDPSHHLELHNYICFAEHYDIHLITCLFIVRWAFIVFGL
jgi:hypothetical protein